MKKTFFALFILTLLFAASCKKNDPNNNTTNLPQSTWTYKGTTYTGDTCRFINGFLAAAVNGSGYGNTPLQLIAFAFANNGIPTTSGTYTVVNHGQLGWSSIPNQITVSATNGSATYNSTGAGNGSQTVQVSISATGKVTVTGNNIELLNALSNSTDSTTINFNVVQDF